MTPFRFYPRLSTELQINLWIKHDDEYPSAGGGSKVRKLRRIIEEAAPDGYNALVTAGGATSNHARAAALIAAQIGWSARIVIQEPEPTVWPANLRLARLAGAELVFCNRKTLPQVMDAEMKRSRDEGLKPLYIYGGGHNAAGARAFRDAAIEMAGQCSDARVRPDFIVLASGTGTTQAGLHVGTAGLMPHARVIGISVAHSQMAGLQRVNDAFRMIDAEVSDRVEFLDRFLAGGYAMTNTDQLETIEWAARTEGLLLDPVYTGKAFHGLRQLVRSGHIARESTVVFWHTGGLCNLLSTEFESVH